MDAKLRIYINKQVNMVRHNFQFKEFNGELYTHRNYKLSKPSFHLMNENLTSVLGTPDDMVFAGIDNIIVGFILHVCIIQEKHK